MNILAGLDNERVHHLFEYSAAPAALCGLDESEVFRIRPRQSEYIENNLCPICKRQLPLLQRAMAARMTFAEAKAEANKLAYWKQHNSLAGFEATN